MESGNIIVGTPDDAIQAIERMLELSGGFGGVLFIAQEWATREQNLRSFELFARYVAPHFRGQLAPRSANADWIHEHKPQIFKSGIEITRKAFADAHVELPESVEKLKLAEELAKGRSRV
jgi:limonene 1,2-monooxygenase